MNWREEVLSFDCGRARLLGILTRPEAPCGVGVVIVVGGPQYRVGSHRQFVSLARSLAQAGFAVLRFDGQGMGDSPGPLRSFEHFGPDIGSAIDALVHAVPQVARVALWGLCDGASAALLYLHERADPRVAGLSLLNPWVRSDASLAKTHVKHYYRQRVAQREFWLKLASGQIAWDAVSGLWRNVCAMRGASPPKATNHTPYQQRMAQAWATFKGPVLLLMSEHDYTAREFDEFSASDEHWRRAFAIRPPERVTLTGADHTCSTPAAQRAAELATTAWAQRMFARAE